MSIFHRSVWAMRAATVCFLTTAAAPCPAREESGAPLTVAIGEKHIILPPPPGYVRADGLFPKWDLIVTSMLPETNRLLANYALPEDIEKLQQEEPPVSGSSCNAQIMKESELQEIGLRTFGDFRNDIVKEFTTSIATLDAEIAKASTKANDYLKKTVDAADKLSFGKSVPLGIFTNSDQAVGFSMLLSVGMAEGEKTASVVSCLIAPVNGRLLFLYNTLPYRAPADQTLAQDQVTRWHKLLAAANPAVPGPAGGWGGIFDRSARACLIGAAAGVVFGLVQWLKRRGKKHA